MIPHQRTLKPADMSGSSRFQIPRHQNHRLFSKNHIQMFFVKIRHIATQ